MLVLPALVPPCTAAGDDEAHAANRVFAFLGSGQGSVRDSPEAPTFTAPKHTPEDYTVSAQFVAVPESPPLAMVRM
jgi:hypothetical protein